MVEKGAIKPIDRSSVHRITSGQVVIDLQTAVKELVENSLDAGATNIEVRFKQYGLKSIEVIDNGSGIAEQYHEGIALKHHTSKLNSFSDLTTVRTFGFRGEALSSLCALSEMVTVVTATEPPLGMSLEMEPSGKIHRRNKVARQRGTTVIISNLFLPLPVRRKELDRNSKREFGKALALLNAYALGPCCRSGAGVRITVSNQVDKGQKSVQFRTAGVSSAREAVAALWGPKALDSLVDLSLNFDIERDQTALKRYHGSTEDLDTVPIIVKGLVSKFSVGGGRTGTDRQFFYVNGRPCNLTKIQKAFNEVYRSFNANQAPFILADFIIPTGLCDINVSPDKRTIFVHSEGNLITKLKAVLEESFAPSRSTYNIESASQRMMQSTLPVRPSTQSKVRAISGLMDESVPMENTDVNMTIARPEVSDPVVRLSSPPQLQKTFLEPGSQPLARHSPGLPEITTLPETSPFQPDYPQIPDKPPQTSSLHPGVSSSIESDATTAQMDIHNDFNPPPSQPTSTRLGRQFLDESRAGTVIVDTSSAAWNHPVQIANPNDNHSGVGDEEVESPVRKKQKSDAGTTSRSWGQNKSKHSHKPTSTTSQGRRKSPDKNTTRDARGQLRNTLVGFARNGSQVARAPQDEDDEEDEDELDELMTSEPCAPPLRLGEVEPETWDGELKAANISRKTASLHLRPSPGGTQSPIQDKLNYSTNGDLVGQSSSSAIDLVSDDELDDPEIPARGLVTCASSVLHQEAAKVIEVACSTDTSSDDVTLRFDLAKVTSTWTQGNKVRSASNSGTALLSIVPPDAGVTNIEDQTRAADALSRVIDKGDFADMEVLGQFNLGFIVARRRKAVVLPNTCGQDGEADSMAGTMDDLFIVDQHAADEKYNFETLQQTTNIQSQKLFRPQDMELTASDELLAIENIDILRQNGFEVEISVEVDCQPGGRLKLTAQPISKGTVFDMKDLEELIHLMRDSPAGQMVRCSKARAMFAMRACRKSVMVGMALNKQHMASVIQHMGTMDQPWNCPHGRPTMRHLFDLSNLRSHDLNPIDWSAFNAE